MPLLPHPALDQETRAYTRSVALLGAGLVGAFALLDLRSGPERTVLLATRASWTALLLAAALLLRPGSRIHPRWPEALAVVGSIAATLAIIALTGGPAGGYFGFLFALPFCIALLLPGELWSAALTGIATTAGGTALLVAADAPAIEIARWSGMAIGMAVLASYATLASRAFLGARLADERARARLAEELAENVQRLAVAERLAAAGQLAAGVAHEVNNPLAFLRTNLEWLREHLASGPPLDADAAEALADAAVGVERIARIVADLGGFCSPGPQSPCGAPIAATIEEALRVVSGRVDARVRVRIDAAAALPAARMCRGRLVQVLGNLIVNAADAALATGGASAWVAVRASTRGDRVLIAVEDGGAGLAPEVRAHLFEPFFTTKPPGRGTGLGLALSREYVTTAGGTIEAVNAPHGGALFEVALPIITTEAPGRCLWCAYRGGGLAPTTAPTPAPRPPPARRAG